MAGPPGVSAPLEAGPAGSPVDSTVGHSPRAHTTRGSSGLGSGPDTHPVAWPGTQALLCLGEKGHLSPFSRSRAQHGACQGGLQGSWMNGLIQQYKPSTYCVPGHRQGRALTALGLLWEEGAQIKVQRQGEECWPSRKGPPVVWEGSATEGELEGTGADIRVRGTDPGARKHCQSLSRGTRRPPSFGNRSRCALTPNTLRWQLSLNPHGGIHTPPQPSGQGHSLWMPRPRSLAPPTSCSWVRLLGGPPYTA